MIQKAKEAAERELNNNGRILLRPSGTEPLIRVMVEGKDPVQVNDIANRLATVISKQLAH